MLIALLVNLEADQGISSISLNPDTVGDFAASGAVVRAGLSMANGRVKGVTKPSAKPS